MSCQSAGHCRRRNLVRAVSNPTSTKLQVAVPDSKWIVAAPDDESSVEALIYSPKEAEPDNIYLPFVCVVDVRQCCHTCQDTP